ncbi:MAG: DUF1080 domain-containing protein [Phycisphaerae bacterium]|jgi:hypothetical protein|nr:DUF1080 domain-containing protein [Phycisphaerae bacterium]
MKPNKMLVAALAVLLVCCSVSPGAGPNPKGDDAAVVCSVKPVAAVPCKPYDAKNPDVSKIPLIGDWAGKIGKDPIVAQVIASGKGEYVVNMMTKFDTRDAKFAVLTGKPDNLVGSTKTGKDGKCVAKLTADSLTGTVEGDGKTSFSLKRVMRLSHRLGAKPPKGAVVLIGPDTKDLSATFTRGGGKPCGWKLLDGGVMQCVPRGGSALTKKKFGSMHLHAEFRTAFMPEAKGQGRSNSGFYIQNRYECQVLDSYGLKGVANECGGMYRAVEPRVNMCAPPGQWQSYDIFFRAPKFDASGSKQIEGAHISVVHNGVLIHNDVVLIKGTGNGGRRKPIAAEFLLLQDHGNPVEFRNIWVAELKKPSTDNGNK